jgi:hypothetical protein
VARQDLAHGLDQALFGHRELGGRLFLQIVVAFLGEPSEFGAQHQVLDLHFAFLLFVRALDRPWSKTLIERVNGALDPST